MFDPKFKMTRENALQFSQNSVTKILQRIHATQQEPLAIATNPVVAALFPDGKSADITPTVDDSGSGLQEFIKKAQMSVEYGCEAIVAAGFSSLREDWRTAELGTHLFNPGEVFEEGQIIADGVVDSLVDGKAYAVSVFLVCRDVSVHQMIPLEWDKSSQRFNMIGGVDAIRTAIEEESDEEWPARDPDEWLPAPAPDRSGLN